MIIKGALEGCKCLVMVTALDASNYADSTPLFSFQSLLVSSIRKYHLPFWRSTHLHITAAAPTSRTPVAYLAANMHRSTH